MKLTLFVTNRMRFGIVSINATSPTRERSAKLSTKWFQEVMRTRELQDIYTNTSQY